VTYDEFVAKWNGVLADYDGYYGAQCVDLFNFYNRDVVKQSFVGTPATGGAADLWNYWKSLSGYTKISRNGVPPKGAVVVWDANTSATGPAGHVGIASGEGNSQSFISFDQNYPIGTKPHMQSHGYAGVLGWYVPINQGDTNVDYKQAWQDATNVAEARRKLLSRLEQAAGVDTGKIDPDQGVDQAIANIAAKNEAIAAKATPLPPGVYIVK
jgi:hypothetical protein